MELKKEIINSEKPEFSPQTEAVEQSLPENVISKEKSDTSASVQHQETSVVPASEITQNIEDVLKPIPEGGASEIQKIDETVEDVLVHGEISDEAGSAHDMTAAITGEE